MAALKVEKRENPNGGFEIQLIRNNGYLSFPNIKNLEKYDSITFSVATENIGIIEIREDSEDGKLLGTCHISSTGGWEQYKSFSCPTIEAKGPADIYLKFIGESKDILHLD